MTKGICYKSNCDSVIELDNGQSVLTRCPYCGGLSDNQNAAIRYRDYQRKMEESGPALSLPSTPDPKMDAASSQPATGQKFDGDKDEPGLLLSGCHRAVAGVIAVLGFGFRKYKERNGWKTVPEAQRRYKDALHRHLAAIERGEIYDNEPGGSGLPHIDHVACNAMFLSQMHHEGFGK